MRNFEAIWLTFMTIFVLLLLIALIALVVKIGTREKQKERDDVFYLTSKNQQQQDYQKNNELLKGFCNFKKKLSANKIDSEIIVERKSSKRAFSIDEEGLAYNENKKKDVDTTSI